MERTEATSILPPESSVMDPAQIDRLLNDCFQVSELEFLIDHPAFAEALRNAKSINQVLDTIELGSEILNDQEP